MNKINNKEYKDLYNNIIILLYNIYVDKYNDKNILDVNNNKLLLNNKYNSEDIKINIINELLYYEDNNY